MKTIVYIDGFNLYYGCLRNSSHKWLNVAEMCRLLLPRHTIINIKYFTAQVRARPNNPDQPVRQQLFLRALRTVPNLEIIFGHFLSSEVLMKVAYPLPGTPAFIKVIKTEEKGSDVNIATYLLRDGFIGAYEAAVLVTNDSDLAEPIRVVRNDLHLPVGILHPPTKHPSVVLRQCSTFMKPIRTGVLAASQFPQIMTDTTGNFTKPSNW